jgi:predicted nucleotidyltransferase
VNYHINNLLKENLIVKIKQKPFPSFRADETGGVYRFHKIQGFLRKILEIGLVDYLYKRLNPRCIILFGSFAKAEYDESSDIDIFIQSKETKINLEKFEKRLKHPINLYFKENINSLSKELFNNIMNGIKLRGYIKIK